MKLGLLLFISLFGMKTIIAQEFVRERDKKTENVLLRGQITFNDILNETSCNWLSKGAEEYQPNRNVVDALSKNSSEYRFVVFVGTWCSDTKDVLPKFYKTLVESGIDLNSVEMYGVNRNKEALNIEHRFYNIKFVPTFIVMHKNREIGRIVESVSSSIEEELNVLIEKDYAMLEQERMKKFK